MARTTTKKTAPLPELASVANTRILMRICAAVEDIAARSVAPTTVQQCEREEPINPHAPTPPVSPWYYKHKLQKYEILDWTRANGGTVWARDKHTNKIRFLGNFDYSLFNRS